MDEELSEQLSQAGDQLRGLAVGVAELVLAVVLASLVARWLRRRIRPRLEDLPSASTGVLIQNAVTGGVYTVALTILLALWGMTWGNLITALSISTVAVAFGFQDFLRSIVGGVLVVVEKPFAPGDRIRVRDIEGRVEQVQLRTTTITTDDGDRVYLPNAIVFSDPLTNRSPNRRKMVLLVSGINADPTEARATASAALAKVPEIARFEVVVRTHRRRVKVREALDALPGIDRSKDTERHASRAVGLKVRWLGDGGKDQRDRVTRALEEAFPGAKIAGGGWG